MIPSKKSDNIIVWNSKVASTETVHTLHISDIHFDSLHCNRELLKKHLDEIKRCNGYVFIYGDWFDVMGCYQDPRSKAKDIDPKYIQRGKEYLNLIVEDSVEFLTPYAKNIAFISEGNHETEIKRRRDVDILDWMIRLLKECGANTIKGHYSGWNEFVMQYKNGEACRSILTHYHHGYGGNAKRSKGMLDSQIATFQYPNADFIFRGHDHQKFHDPSNVKFLYDKAKKVVTTSVTHYIKTGSYKDGLGAGLGGWEVQKGFMPTKLGGWFIDLTFIKSNKDSRIETTVREAN